MSSILIPVPKTPLATIQTDQAGRASVVMSREWYRYFSLLQKASGGSTDTNIDVLVLSGVTDPPTEQEGALNPQIPGPFEPSPATPDVPFPMPPTELGEIEAEIADLETEVAALQVAVGTLQTDVGALQTDVSALQGDVTNLQAAENLIYRIVDAGAAILAAGTATVASAQADSANQFALTAKVVGGTQGWLSVGTVIANTSFVINSSAPLDTSTVSWVIFRAI